MRGDWEGATVAPSKEGNTFDYAAFSQHGTSYAYLRNVLRCEDAPAESLPERGSCGPSSTRIDDLVADRKVTVITRISRSKVRQVSRRAAVVGATD